MMGKNDVRLVVDGKEYGGWKSVRIAAGIERVARSFDLGITTQWPGSDVARKVLPGMACEVYIGDDKVVTGYIDATPINYDGKSKSVIVKGRSKTADLVDCCPLNMVPPGGWAEVDNGKGGPRPQTQRADTQWTNRKLEQIAAYIAAPYKVKVKTEANTGAAITVENLNFGEKAFEVIDRLMLKRQVLATDDADGNLVIMRAGSGGNCTTPLVLGGNILKASAQMDYSNVYTHYTCSGFRAYTDADNDAAISRGESASVVDSSIFGKQRVRALHIQQSGQTDDGSCRARVEYESGHRAAKAVETTYTVLGWRQEDGSLWLPNKLVQVQDTEIGFDMRLLIVEATWSLDENGMRTELRVGPKKGYLTKPEKDNTPNWSEVKK